MKTLLLVTIIFLIAFAASSDGCQDVAEKPNLYLNEVTYSNRYCLFKQFSDKDSRERYDTICIMCTPETLTFYSCPVRLSDYRSVWRQEYNASENIVTGTVMYLEKIPGECIYCPPGKKRYIKTFFGDR